MCLPETVQISIDKASLIDRNFCILGGKHRDLSRILSASASASCSQSLRGTQHLGAHSLLCGGGRGGCGDAGMQGMQGRSDEPAAPDVAAPPTGGDPGPSPPLRRTRAGQPAPPGREHSRPTEPH